MLNIFIGDLMLLLGFGVLLLPLLVTELSRPRDALWGAIGLFLGVSLVTNNDRLNGGLIIVVMSGTLLIGRLGVEVAQSRWQQLSDEEKKRLGSLERWHTSIEQVVASITQLAVVFKDLLKFAFQISNSKKIEKKWIRAEKNQEQQGSVEVATNSKEQFQSSKSDLEEQLQETLEGHRPPKDS